MPTVAASFILVVTANRWLSASTQPAVTGARSLLTRATLSNCTGVSLHPNLAHIVRVDGQDDLSAHGTHVCGIVTARPGKPGDFAGFAPAASVFTRRVFQFDKDGQISLPDQRDLAAAIEDFSGLGSDSGSQMDLINLSLGGAHSDQTHDAVKVARQNGTLCVCSAGNSSGGVEFPAAYPEAAAVTALGKKDWGPRNSITALMTPDSEKQPDRFAHDGLFLALFSCFGASVNCTAPGAGIISTVPPSSDHPAPYAVMDGTSLSCPAVVGVLADVLSRSPAYMSRARDAGRSDAAVALLRAYCESIGLDSQYAGAGMPDCTSGSGNPIRDSIASNRESSRK